MVRGPSNGASGSWRGRVRFDAGGGFAYRPGELLVRREVVESAERTLRERFTREEDGGQLARDEEPVGDSFVLLTGVPEQRKALDALHRVGILAQPNHVLFATCCCPPHPASPQAEAFYASPYYANMMKANPYHANPYHANPYHANAGLGGCCCAGCGGGAGPGANPYHANPYHANADPSPYVAGWIQATGRRPSSARPTTRPDAMPSQPPDDRRQVRIAILDTGWAMSHPPTEMVPDVDTTSDLHGGDHPDEVGDGFLDPAAGHGTFIAGVIERIAPGCTLELIRTLSTYGDGDEAEIVKVISELASRTDGTRPDFVNLSFGGYAPLGMTALTDAIAKLQDAETIVVASAGNDATCRPMYPGALADVISVAALDDDGDPALFTNYGPWVTACAPGVDVVSIFYDGFDGAEPAVDGVDEDKFDGWAVWSGTSFAAPRVVAELAKLVQAGASPQDAVEQLVTGPGLTRRPMLGTVVA